MKFNYLIKALPILSIFLLVIYLSFSNQKEYIKLRILIWNTPSLTLGRYLAISTGTGFILSYLITANLAKINKSKHLQPEIFNERIKKEDSHQYQEENANQSYDKTLIERDITDPSPTINANFRIIGKKESSNINYRVNKNFENSGSIQFEEQYDEHPNNNDTFTKVMNDYNDWNDESYSQW